jgi:hypothetical protein
MSIYRLYLLSYQPFLIRYFERVRGIGPLYPTWQAGVLPLNYTRLCPSTTLRTTAGRPAYVGVLKL